MQKEFNYKFIFWVLLIAAAAIRLFAVAYYADTNPATANLWEFGEQARNYIEHGNISFTYENVRVPSANTPPGIVVALIVLFKLFGISSLALKSMLAINFLFSLLIVYFTYRLALLLTKNLNVSLLSLFLVSFYPSFVYVGATYHSFNVAVGLFLLAIYLALSFFENNKTVYLILLGLTCGLMILFRGNFIVYALLLSAFLFFYSKPIKKIVIVLLIAMAVISPWVIRNYLTFDQVIIGANTLGFNLWRGHNDQCSGSGETDKLRKPDLSLNQKMAALPKDSLYESRRDKVMLNHALQYIKDNPVKELNMIGKKLMLFWVWEFYDTEFTHSLIYLVPHFLTLTLFVFGFILAYFSMNRVYWQLLAWIFVLQSIEIVIFFVLIRYRMTIEPLIFIFSAIAFESLWRKLFKQEQMSIGN